MTPSNAAPLAHGTTPVQGWMNRIEVNTIAARVVVPDDFPVVIVPLSLDASGQRVVPDELVERCARASYEQLRAPYQLEWESPPEDEEFRDSWRKHARAVLSAALLSAGSLGLPK